jgi:hypothetical protein
MLSTVHCARSTGCASPCSFNPERAEVFGFFLIEVVLKEAVDPGAARATAKAFAKLAEILRRSGGDDLHIAVFGIAHPAAQVELAGFAMDKPAKAYALYATLDKEMENHDAVTTNQRQFFRYASAAQLCQSADWVRRSVSGSVNQEGPWYCCFQQGNTGAVHLPKFASPSQT